MLRWILIAIAVLLVYRIYKHARPQLPTASSDRSPYEVLGVDEDADQPAIRSAYQKAIREYHPDKVASMAPELRKLAERRTMEINAAYEQLRKD